ncbi:MAG: replicative DNA helicase [Trichococcus flocculiformis]|jgi:replicative DNA helicase|uniref:Replicative DNA helicase n=1 Tax=Trichococcus flocculiformis TaxID=82803 RepID=A0A143YQN7_9LACT|nr:MULTISPECIES: replicative DNA helicase [Trichococcus]MBP6164732.1 replicative DNA helicase [Trichococcus sp.]MBP6247582.1 replicative DNA helicase [Trichococcus sp.]MBP8683029.1 replicative DNA helicase [Trichococcus sp.]MBP9593942.1 replicative DNA helicase [Trichococcus sp.]MBP9976587.1 replicative DNA helicase [Trichococcus sp.]
MEETLQDRIPPHSIEAEQSVLGSIFLDPETVVNVLEYLETSDFYRKNHQIIFDAILQLNNRNEAIDVVTIANELDTKNQLENAGGMEYLAELAVAVPTSANVEYYAKIVEEKSILRNLIRSATEIVRKGYEEGDELAVMLDSAEQNILQVSERRNRSGFIRISDVVSASLQNIESLAQQSDDVTGVPTGYIALDKMTAGLQKEELIILAARPAVGKTAFALNIAQNVATKADQVVAIFSLEMGAESLVNRMLCAEGNIDAGHLRTGQLSEDEWSNLIMAMGTLGQSKIFIDDTPGIRIAEIRAKSRRLLQEQGKLGLIVIDYLQLIEGNNRESRQQEVSDISRQLKKLAKELKVPVIALSQLSRGVEQRQDKRPVLSDIRESGSIEQDADIVAFLYRDDYYEREGGEEPERDEQENNVVEVIIEKNRSGARGTVKLLFKKEFNKFSSMSYMPEIS